jgi:hypothetical protein
MPTAGHVESQPRERGHRVDPRDTGFSQQGRHRFQLILLAAYRLSAPERSLAEQQFGGTQA